MYLQDMMEGKTFIYNENVFISTPTGSGKSTYALNLSLNYIKDDKNVLLLVPRTPLKEQYEANWRGLVSGSLEEVKQYQNNFRIRTYQEVEMIVKNKGRLYEKYDLIICDECHYFLTDCSFNKDTVLSYAYVKNQKNALRIFMSATMERFKKMMVADQKLKLFNLNTLNDSCGMEVLVTGKSVQYYSEYDMEKDYSYLEFFYIRNDSDIESILTSDKGKSLVFVDSKKTGEELLEKMQKKKIDSAFLSADNKNTDGKSVINSMSVGKRFSQKVLLATSVLDVGVSIEDEQVSNIFISACTEESCLQMLGRIRKNPKRKKLNVYLYLRDYNFFSRKMNTGVKAQIEALEYIKRHEDSLEEVFRVDREKKPEEELILRYAAKMIYTDNETKRLMINPFIYKEVYDSYKFICNMMVKINGDPYAFIKEQLRWFGAIETFSFKKDMRKKCMKNILTEIFKEIQKEYDASKQYSFNEIKAFLNDRVRLLVRRYDMRIIRSNEALSINKFNEFSSNSNLNFLIAKKEELNGKAVSYYWKYNN